MTIGRVNKWALQDAKNQFSRVVELARKKGPQTVTRHGEPVAVIVSAEEFKQLSKPKETVLEFLAPLRNSGIRLERNRDVPRTRKI